MDIRSLKSNGELLKSDDWLDIKNYESYHIPILYIDGNLTGMTKDDAVALNYIYGDRSGTCTLKWQGSSAISLPKKNYTIKFDNAFEVVSGWGEQKKYCLKANFVDSSHARNIVCAKLWGQIVKSRATANETLNALPNGGAVDGFPIILSLNGKFQGIYTWNIPKDSWMFGMDGTGQQAIICAEYNNNGAVAFKGLATLTEDANGQLDFDLEYSSDDQLEWVVTSLNRLLNAVMNSDGTNIEYGITPYLDWDSAIDYYIHAVLTGNYDGLFRNYLLATYDGVKWFFTGYDMDVALGLRAMGRYFYPANHNSMSFTLMASEHKLFNLIWTYMRPQLRARYEELRESVMSVYNVADAFTNFAVDIPLVAYVDDARLWETIPSTSANNIPQIVNYYDFRCRLADEWIASTSGEMELPEQVDPDIILSSITATYSGGDVAVGTELSTLTGIAVKAVYSDGSTVTVTDYELSGTIAEGTNTITVAYEGLTTTFTVTGVVEVSYTNQVPISVDTNGDVFNDDGWIGATRLSSSGVTKTANYVSTTGYIPASSGAIVRIGTELCGWDSNSDYICTYDSSFTFLTALSGTGTYDGGTISTEDNAKAITLPTNDSIAYVRVSQMCDDADAVWSMLSDKTQGLGEHMIVTVNEKIV